MHLWPFRRKEIDVKKLNLKWPEKVKECKYINKNDDDDNDDDSTENE